MNKNIPSHFISCCSDCSKVFHRSCKNIDLSCPNCAPFKPTLESCKAHLVEEQDLINQRIAEIIITISEKELPFRHEAQKLSPGILTKTLEKTLEKYGGSRKAFFQSYSAAHLIKMGNNLSKITDDLPAEIVTDERITVIFEAIKLFFAAKKSMKKDFMTDAEIEEMKEKILEFGNYMKENLGSLKTKQKGHIFLFEVPKFVSQFRTASFFSDEPVEAYHPLMNEQEKRLKFKDDPKRYSLLMKWAIDHNYYFDNVDCKGFEEQKNNSVNR
uniref:Uncharacterized protein n=1 Tax=Panagrolaimus sp. ES5 TaxID=591445 RepID=A0AC34GYJ4_9BILA